MIPDIVDFFWRVAGACMIGRQYPRPTAKNGDTGYRPLSALIDYNKEINLEAILTSDEHEANPSDRTENSGTMNDFEVQCFKKGTDGLEIRVPFIARVIFENAKCMIPDQGESMHVGTGEACEIQVEGTKEFIDKYPMYASVSYAVVRAAPVESH